MSRASGRKNPVRTPVVPDSPEGREIGLSVQQDPSGAPINSQTGNIVNYPTVRREPAVGQSFPEHRGMMAHGVPPEEQTTEERAEMERNGALPHRPAGPPEYYRPHEKPTPVPVYLTTPAAGSRALGTISTAKITVPAAGSDPVRVAGRDLDRDAMYLMVETATGTPGNASLTPPAVPATTVAQQNINGFPVTVVISANGATISAVTVNGLTVGAAAGTYVVPAYGSIAISYTVATPTWTWTGIGNGSVTGTGIRISKEVALLSAGQGALLRTGATSYQKLDEQQDELFAVSNDSTACIVSVLYLYRQPATA